MKVNYESLTLIKLNTETTQHLLIKTIGTMDGFAFIQQLEKFGVEELSLVNRKLVIPKSQVKDIISFQNELGKLSKAGRSFLTQVDQVSIEIKLDSYWDDYTKQHIKLHESQVAMLAQAQTDEESHIKLIEFILNSKKDEHQSPCDGLHDSNISASPQAKSPGFFSNCNNTHEDTPVDKELNTNSSLNTKNH